MRQTAFAEGKLFWRRPFLCNSEFDKNISASSKQFKTNGKSQPLGSDSFCEICIAEFINNVFKMCPA